MSNLPQSVPIVSVQNPVIDFPSKPAYLAHKSDVEKLRYKKVDSFKNLFPVYANYKFYLGIASFSFYPELENFAIQNGVAILKQKGEVFEIEANNLKAY